MDLPELKKQLENVVKRLSSHTTEFDQCNNDEIAVKVSSHLLTRQAQLHWLVELTKEHRVHQELLKSYSQDILEDAWASVDAPKQSHPEERAYRLAVTDLFVEKAQAFLEERAKSYQRSGKIARRMASVVIIVGACLAWYQMMLDPPTIPKNWLEFTSGFTRAFTAYGFIVLAAVGFWRYSKSMLDQSERLYERRHALRQGRLFVHLNDGSLTVEEMEKAFRWNESQENAFASINTEASAPWGVVAKELAKTFPEIFKAGLQSVGKGKSEEK